jgi:RNA polymerase sigma-70 factor (ECF subfamily)
MDAIGEQSLQWFAAERVVAEPDLAALVQVYSGLLYRVALSLVLVRNPSEAEDVVQDVFLLERKRELAGIVELRPWLVRIAWNLALDRCRRVRPRQMDDLFTEALVSADLPADEALAEAGRIRQVLGAIERLPKRERQALLLSAMDELSTAEIGAVLGRSESSVRSLLFRARAHLRQRLED